MEDKKEWKTEEKSDIEIRDLSVTFQDGGEMIHAMEDVSAYFPSGSVTGLIGESGSGKSMTLRCIAGIQTPDSGRIVVNDKVLFDSEKKINLNVERISESAKEKVEAKGGKVEVK